MNKKIKIGNTKEKKRKERIKCSILELIQLPKEEIYIKKQIIMRKLMEQKHGKEEINENILVERVKITNDEGAKAIGKPVGDYITIDIKKLKIASEEEINLAGETLSKELVKLVDKHIDKKGEILVVGLGNMYVTPDSLGPKVVNDIEVTRHIINYLPQYVEEGTRMVSAISPGVLGTTGIETMEIVKGIVDNINPKLVIVIDALASNSLDRLNKTIQMTSSGIAPGSGVGNNRLEISKNTLNIPVIAIGVPTVVDATTIVKDTLQLLLKQISYLLNNIRKGSKM